MAGFRPLNTEEWMKSVESRFSRLFRRIGGGRDTAFGEVTYELTPVGGEAVGGAYSIYQPGWGWEPTRSYFRATLTRAGIVVLQGLYRTAVNHSANQTIFQLPAGLWPDFDAKFIASRGGAAGVITVTAAGEVKLDAALNAGQYISLENIRYPAAGIASWTDFTLLNGWDPFQPLVYGTPGWWQDGYGFTWQRGMICDGSIPDGTDYAIVVGKASPTGFQQHFPSAHNGGFGSIGSSGDNQFEVKGGITSSTSAWLSLTGGLITTAAAYAHPDVHWVRPKLAGSWIPNNASAQPTLHMGQRSDGLCVSTGLLAGGPANSTLCIQPGEVQPRNRRQMAINSNNAFGYAEQQAQNDYAGGASYPPGAFKFVTGSTWWSMDGLAWFAEGG